MLATAVHCTLAILLAVESDASTDRICVSSENNPCDAAIWFYFLPELLLAGPGPLPLLCGASAPSLTLKARDCP